jgi:predicted RNase H-like nuclease (RuvC/YqgF family)
MNTPNQLSDTPRTDLAWAKTFEDDDDQCRAGNAATDMRDACAKIERELAVLTAERDQLHAQLRALTLICGTNDANKFETWIDRANARAERAEAELAAAKERLRSEAMDDYASIKDLQRELATERARLDWLEDSSRCYHVCIDRQPDGYSIHNMTPSTGSVRSAIDAAMKGGAK